MLGCSEMFTALWLAPAARLAMEDIIAAHCSNHSSLTINHDPAHSLSPTPTELQEAALQGHFKWPPRMLIIINPC